MLRCNYTSQQHITHTVKTRDKDKADKKKYQDPKGQRITGLETFLVLKLAKLRNLKQIM